MPTSSAPSDAGAPSQALVPALDDVEVGQAALDRDLARDRLGERAPAGVAGADEEDASCAQASPMRSGTLSRSVAAAIAPGRITRGRAAGAIDHGRRLRGREPAAVEHAQRAARDRLAPLRDDLARRHRRRHPGPVRARRRDRLAVRAGSAARVAAMRRPPNRDAALRPAQPRGHAPLAAGKHERERPGPVPRRESRRVAR